MVTDRHESEDVTPVPSRVIKVKVSTHGADSREPGLRDIFPLRVYQGYTQLFPGYEHLHIHLPESLRFQSWQMWTCGCLYLCSLCGGSLTGRPRP